MRHSGETQFAVLPVFSLLSSVAGSLYAAFVPSLLRGRGSCGCGLPRICELSFVTTGLFRASGLARQTLAELFCVSSREFISVVRCPAHDVKPQLWFCPQLVHFFLCGVFHVSDQGFGQASFHLRFSSLLLSGGGGACCFTYAFHA